MYLDEQGFDLDGTGRTSENDTSWRAPNVSFTPAGGGLSREAALEQYKGIYGANLDAGRLAQFDNWWNNARESGAYQGAGYGKSWADLLPEIQARANAEFPTQQGGPAPQAAPSGPVSSGAPQSIQPFAQPFAFDQSKVGTSDAFKFRFDKAMQAIERSGAAKGTLLTPQNLNALQREASGLASEELGAEFDRQYATHGRNFDVQTTDEMNRFNSQRLNRGDDFSFMDRNRTFDRGVLESDRGFNYGRERDRIGDEWRFIDYGYWAARNSG